MKSTLRTGAYAVMERWVAVYRDMERIRRMNPAFAGMIVLGGVCVGVAGVTFVVGIAGFADALVGARSIRAMTSEVQRALVLELIALAGLIGWVSFATMLTGLSRELLLRIAFATGVVMAYIHLVARSPLFATIVLFAIGIVAAIPKRAVRVALVLVVSVLFVPVALSFIDSAIFNRLSISEAMTAFSALSILIALLWVRALPFKG